MKRNLRNLLSALGALAIATMLSQAAGAQCGLPKTHIKPTSFNGSFGNARLQLAGYEKDADDREHGPSIVGMWHTTFTANTTNGAPIPETQIDNSLVVWHSDHTEIMNSGRPPQDGDFCLGVWEQTGRSDYKLNHFAWMGNSYSPGTAEGVVGPPVGPAHYTENVALSPDGKHYVGTFTLKAYDVSGNLLVSFSGVVKGTRITINTSVADLM